MTATPKWKPTDWGWNAETDTHAGQTRWVAQVYLDPPLEWRVFCGARLVASGRVDEGPVRKRPALAKRRAMVVLTSLHPGLRHTTKRRRTRKAEDS